MAHMGCQSDMLGAAVAVKRIGSGAGTWEKCGRVLRNGSLE